MTTPPLPSQPSTEPAAYRPVYPSTPPLPKLPAHRQRIMWVVAGVMIAFLLIAGGVFGAYYLQSPQREEMLLSKQLKNLTSLEFQLLLIPDSTEKQQLQVRLSGAYNNKNAAQHNSRVSLQVMPSPDASVLTADAEMISVNELIYLRFLTLPSIAQFNIQSAAEQWIKIDTKKPPVLLKTLGFFPDQNTLEPLAFTEAFQQHSFIRLERKVGTTTVDGKEVTRYPLRFEKEEFALFLEEVETSVQQRLGTAVKTERIRTYADDIDGVTGEVWVGSDDHLPYRLQLSFLRPDGMTAEVTLDFSKHNKDIAIDAPAQSKTVEQVLQQALGGVLTSTKSSSTAQNDERVMNPALDSDDDGLTNGEEQDLATDPLTADTDGDGYLDGEEVENGFDPNGAGALK